MDESSSSSPSVSSLGRQGQTHKADNIDDVPSTSAAVVHVTNMIAQTEADVIASRSNKDKPLALHYVRNAANHNRPLLDGHGRPVSIDRLLATKPLRQDLSVRPGPGNKRLTYITGEAVNRLLNEIFGHDGWSSDIKNITQTGKEKDKRGRWNVAYLAHVRITLTKCGTYKEDMGSGDSTDHNLQTAISHALKASITDALKRAARQFGEKLGNSIYAADFVVSKAPTDVFQAIEEYDRDMRTKWGTSNVPIVADDQQNHHTKASLTVVTSRGTTTASSTDATTRQMPPPPAPYNYQNHVTTAVVTPKETSTAPGSNTFVSTTHGGSNESRHTTPYTTTQQYQPRSAPVSVPQFRPIEQNAVNTERRPPLTSAESLRASFGDGDVPPLLQLQQQQQQQQHPYMARSQPQLQQQPSSSSYTKRPGDPPVYVHDVGKRPRIHGNPYAPH
jgi:DNA recombination protein Rad52